MENQDYVISTNQGYQRMLLEDKEQEENEEFSLITESNKKNINENATLNYQEYNILEAAVGYFINAQKTELLNNEYPFSYDDVDAVWERVMIRK